MNYSFAFVDKSQVFTLLSLLTKNLICFGFREQQYYYSSFVLHVHLNKIIFLKVLIIDNSLLLNNSEQTEILEGAFILV